jgi:multisubunit Na+/H+ antiporter MnhE subunit
MASCIVFFLLGFLTDKIRLFPFLLGIIVGVILKSLFENPCMFDDDDQNITTCIYNTVRSSFTTILDKEKVSEG